jgi:hypothetical protein
VIDDRPAEILLELRKNGGREDAADAASVERENLKAVRRSVYSRRSRSCDRLRPRWARSDAAALFAALEASFEPSVFPAADAAFAPVFLLLPTCERSEAAALFAAFEAVFEASVFPAADAADLPVLRPAIS